ncbi:MAG: hypothetical protein A2Y10_18605 [Planctomycetes bacterium GWF2_41_51]|nr:MAG: hypothetical protein A2Y10_18605 [Planctomycetes bacterium GWF2_41_51]
MFNKKNVIILVLIAVFAGLANAAVPVITLQPVSQVADSGGTVVLTIAGDVVTSYAWYKRSNMDEMTTPVPASDIYQGGTNTLTITNVDLSKEGAYYCVLTNGSGNTISNVVTVMTMRLVSKWELEDNSFEDAVSGYDGASPSYPDYPAIVEGVVPGTYAAYFSGTTGDTVFVTPFKRKLNLNSFTICAWAKVTGGSGYRAVLSTRHDAPNTGYYFYAQSDNTWSFWTGYGNQWNKVGGNVPIVNDQWVFLVGTYDAQTNVQNLYVDATLSKSVVATPMMPSTASDLLIGSVTASTLPFVGSIDDVRYYSYPLSPAQIASLYSEKSGKPVIMVQPQSKVAAVGNTMEFKVNAVDPNPLTYAWYKSSDWSNSTPSDDTAIGMDSNTLTIINFQLANEGFYYCVISNSSDSQATNAVYAMAERLIAHWEFENNLTDSIGDLDLTRNTGGSSVFGQGRMGSKALQVSTIDDRVEVSSPFLKLPTFTVSAWAKLTGGTYYRAIMSTRPDSGNSCGYFIAAGEDNRWTFWTGDNTTLWNNRATDGTAVLNEWAYLVGTYNSETNEQSIYVNGVLASKVNANPIYLDNSLRFLIGSATVSTLNFVGLIDDVKYYDYVLPPEVIAQHYADTTGQDVCVSFPEHDYNQDCVVNFTDFAAWAESWLQSNIVHPN